MAGKIPKILIVGNICKDIIYTTNEYPTEDTKVKAYGRLVRIGGNAGNVSLALSQLPKISVSCCIKIGDCDYSRDLKDQLSGVELITVIQKSVSIPESVIIHSIKTLTRTCLHYRGSCSDLTCNQVLKHVSDIGQYDWVHLEHRRNGIDVLKLAEHIKFTYPNVILSLEIEKIRDGFEEIIQIVDYPIISKEVCMELGYTNVQQALQDLSQKVSNAVIVTWAEFGAGAWVKEKRLIEEVTKSDKIHVIGENMIHCDAFHVDNIVDTIGAGDTFTAGFIDTMLKTGNMCSALLRACKLAAHKLTVQGMQLNLGSEDQMFSDL